MSESAEGVACLASPTRQEAFKQFFVLVAYAEIRAILLACVSAPPWNPIAETWSAAWQALEEDLVPGTEAFRSRALEALRESSRTVLAAARHRGGPDLHDRPIARGQLGGFGGIEDIFDEAGRLAIWHRDRDLGLLRIAIQLFDRFWPLVLQRTPTG